MSCDNLCTAAKCQELEDRINALEQALALLEASFVAHTNQDIPEAHDYEEPDVNVSLAVAGNDLKVFVKVGNKSDDETTTLPIPDEPEVSVSLAVAGQDLKVFVQVGNKSGDETITLPKPEEPEVGVAVFDLGDNQFGISVQVGTKQDQDDFAIALPEPIEPIEPVPVTISGSASFYDDTLTITIATPDDSDTFQVEIPRGGSGGGGGSGGEPEPINLVGAASFENNILTITIAGGGGQTTFQVEIPMDNELLAQVFERVETIYKILGGTAWAELGTGSTKTVSLTVDPEDKIKEVGELLYEPDIVDLNQLTVTNLLELITVFSTVDFYRSGHHRLPAKTLKSLINSQDGNQEITIYDTFSWQEYLVKQIDALVGEFPIKIKHKTLDSSDQEVEQDIEISNISVAIAEILALNFGITHDTDTAINIGMKTLIEARNAANAAIVGVDYVKANTEYLGYKGNQKIKEVDCTFTPNAKNLRLALEPSTQKIVGWANEDQETLIELIKKTLIGTEIIKAALFHPYENGGTVTGDNISANLSQNETKNETEWEQFKQRINNPSGRYQVPKPQANIRDLTIDEPNP
jgi:hypothetical protein